MKGLRLLGVTTSFPLRRDSSAGIFVRRLYESLPEGWRVDVACPDDDVGVDADEYAGVARVAIRLHPVSYAPRCWQVLAQKSGGVASGLKAAPWRFLLVPSLLIGLLWRILREGRHADLLHANWAICGAMAVVAGKLLMRRVVTTLRGDDVTRADASCLDRVLLGAAVHGSAAIVCVSAAMAEQLRLRFPSRRNAIHVCLNGVDPMLLRIQKVPGELGALRVAVIGSLIRRKGLDVLIDAVALTRSRDAIRVRIVGDGPELESLRSQARRLGLVDSIQFLGEVAPSAVPGFLADADVLVLASRSEGRPNVVIEALAAGLPVISTDLPGVIGLVEPGVNGWCVPVNDVNSLAAALDEAVDSPGLLMRMAASARSRIAQTGHDWAATGRCYDSVFRGVLGIESGAE